MKTRMCLLVAGLMTASVHAAAATYYASPDGRGDGLSLERPFTIANFWPVAKPGDVRLLLDGNYKGEDSMIAPTRGLSGVPGNPISVKASHDGKVLIDGERQRLPVCLRGNAWFVLEGFNVCRAGGRGNASVIGLGGNASEGGSAHTVVRRVVAWDAKDDSNSCVWSLVNSDHVLLEDVAGFGVGRKTFVPFRRKHTTIRRAWGRWEGYHAMGPKMTFCLYYNSYHTIIENCIGTWGCGGQWQCRSYPKSTLPAARCPARPTAPTFGRSRG